MSEEDRQETVKSDVAEEPSTAPDAGPAPAPIPGIIRAFLRGDLAKVDPQLLAWLDILSSVGAGECWHKKSSFKSHLFEVYKICKIWGQDEDVCRCALFHSAYSNSYVNLAVFQEPTERETLAEIVGTSAEQLIHNFCIVPRHHLIYERLLKAAPTAEELAGGGMGGLNRLLPAEGVSVPHIKTGEPVTVDRLMVARFLVLTMADFAEQLFSWQDTMFQNTDGRLNYAGSNPSSLWPGVCKPGLWHSALSRMGALLRHTLVGPDGTPLVPLPPVFESCSVVITEADQAAARDAYWEAVTEHTEGEQQEEALRLLRTAAWHNPYVAEPHVLLSQILLQRAQWAEARRHADRALTLLTEWGTVWDKRMPWDAWVAMARVCAAGAAAQRWPNTAFGMLNLGLVSGLDESYDV